MRIFVLATWYPSPAEPLLGVFVEEQALALQARHEVVVLAPERHSWRETMRGGARARPAIERRRGIDVVRVAAGSPLPWSWRVRQAAYVRAVRRAFGEAVRTFGRPDLIHAHVVLPGGDAAVQIGKAADIPVVLTEHSNPFTMHLADSGHRRRVAATLGGASAVVAVSPSMREQMLAFRPETSIEVVGNVIDTDFFSPAPQGKAESEEFRLLSVGLLTRSKGMHNVIDALALAAPRMAAPPLLTIGGNGPERPALERQARDAGIRDRIQFAGNLDRGPVRDAMRGSDAFVLASDTETFGVVVAEAMACGCPVIATRSGGPEWLMPPGGGQLVPPGDIPSLAEAIVSLASGRVETDRDAARRSIVERFGPAAVVDQLDRVYRSALGNPAR